MISLYLLAPFSDNSSPKQSKSSSFKRFFPTPLILNFSLLKQIQQENTTLVKQWTFYLTHSFYLANLLVI